MHDLFAAPAESAMVSSTNAPTITPERRVRRDHVRAALT